MSAVEQFKQRARTAKELEAIHCRIAIEQSLADDVPADLLAEAAVDFADNGRTATLRFDGHLPIHVILREYPDGMPAELIFSVVDVERRRCLTMTPRLDEAIKKAEDPE